MNTAIPTRQNHRSHRAATLRASILGANDGIVSIASLILGVTASQASIEVVLTAGIAGLVAGAMSMAAGEYVSVSSQRDSEKADLKIEQNELILYEAEEQQELTNIYISKGIEPDLARKVAKQIHEHDALAAHASEELGINSEKLANPLSAGISSSASFVLGGAVPILTSLLSPTALSEIAIIVTSLIALYISGVFGAHIGGGSQNKAGIRVLIGGSLAMAISMAIGALIGRTM